jgi:antitoxin PrlF
MITNMTSKGQVLMPKHVRDAVGLIPGRPVKVELNEAGEAVVRPVTAAIDTAEARRLEMRARIEKVAGIFAGGETTDEFMARIREPLP